MELSGVPAADTVNFRYVCRSREVSRTRRLFAVPWTAEALPEST